MNHKMLLLIGTTLLAASACRESDATKTPAADTGPATVVMNEAGSPFISFNIWFQFGSQHDPAGKEGLASLTAQFLADSATTQHTYEQILDALYPLATNYRASVDKEMTVFTGNVHKDNLDEFYILFKNAILSPAFNEADFKRIKGRTVTSLQKTRRYSSDEELGKELLFNRIFAGTPYAHPEEGYVSSVEGITLEDVKNFYGVHYRRGSVVIGIGGDIPDGFVDKVKADFVNLPEGNAPVVPVPEPKPIAGTHVLIVEKDTNATAISLGYPIDLTRADKDFSAMQLANSWFGEHRTGASHLYQVIRLARGMNYGDYSYIEAYPGGHRTQFPPTNVSRHKQIFQIWIRPISRLTEGDMHDRTLFALRAALREERNLIDSGLTAEELETTRNYLINYTVNWGATVSRRLAYRVDDRFYGIPDPGHLAAIKVCRLPQK